MDTLLFGTLSALWLGILTSISPCPLATNIVAISFIGKGVGRPYHVLLLGLSYTFGRMIAYFVLGILITKGILSIPGVSYFLQTYLNKLLGPLLIVVGMFLVELIKVNISWAPDSDTIEKHAEKDSLRGAVLLGSLFALSFCPVSAALFFGSLIPLSVKYSSVVALPFSYGIGTGLPVILSAILLAGGARSVAKAFNKLTRVEWWVRRITGGIFILTGIYYCLTYIFEVL
ncbi:MAG: aromatic aminobenezylarsenical efflux permease ArsG family transporter [Deltaproteobacteria bacterium]|jgi:cytochrome c biogenesis protein CcdA|nr:aromatic aminobenezylarsenical efflux permease ArsG family transporter [Deltaproteobacteria bacterium]